MNGVIDVDKIKVACPNCCGHSWLTTQHGECEYCGSPLTAPVAISPTRRKSVIVIEQEKQIKSALCGCGMMTASQIAAKTNMDTQKCSAILRNLMQNGEVVRIIDKKKKVNFFLNNAWQIQNPMV